MRDIVTKYVSTFYKINSQQFGCCSVQVATVSVQYIPYELIQYTEHQASTYPIKNKNTSSPLKNLEASVKVQGVLFRSRTPIDPYRDLNPLRLAGNRGSDSTVPIPAQ